MDWKQRIQRALEASGAPPDDDVAEELAQHAQSLYESEQAAGNTAEEAAQRVEREIAMWASGSSLLHRRSRRTPAVEGPPAASTPLAGLAQDIRYAARLLRRQPLFAVLVILTMALGIGATTTLFSVTYGVLMKPLPWPEPSRLVLLRETRGGNAPRFGSFSNAPYLAWKEKPATIEDLAAWSTGAATLQDAGDPVRIRIVKATASLFPVLGARPLIGSLFQAKDEPSPGATPSEITRAAMGGVSGRAATSVAVLSESFWKQRFGADPAVLGRVVRLDGEAHTIVGVLPDALGYPDREVQAWVPFRVPPAQGNLISMFQAIARLRPGVTPERAAAEGTARGRFAPDGGMTSTAIFGSRGAIEVAARPLQDAVTADVRRPLLVLLVAVGLLLATATANVASLQLARATTRAREMAVRAALGAGSARITRQLLVENGLLGVAGGLAGLALVWSLHRVLPSVLPAGFPRAQELGVDAMVVAFGMVLALLAAVLFGVLPAIHARRLNLVQLLAADGRSPAGVSTRTRTGQARMAIMAGQVAVACVLLVGASLLGRSFVALLEADRGYDPSGVITARLALTAQSFTPDRRHAVVSQILERLEAMPGVSAAAFTSEFPLTPGGSTSAFTMAAPHADGGTISVQASPRIVSPALFPALAQHIVTGRGFADSDTDTSPAVAVVNEAFARRYLGDSPLTARLPMASAYWTRNDQAAVVGIVGDVRYLTSTDSTQPEIYFSYRQLRGKLPIPVVNLVVRTTVDPRSLLPVIRLAVREVDDSLVPEAVMTMEDRIWTSLARPRLYAVLLGGFAGFSLAVAAVGLFGVLSYAVAQRSRELAVRTALGARQADIFRLVAGQGLKVTIAGLVLGLAASAAVVRSIAALLYGVTEHDPLTYLAVPLILILVAAAACIIPARRAARIDPLEVLREG